MKDLIERQAIINELESWLKAKGYSEGELNIIKAVLYELQSLPSAQQDVTDTNVGDMISRQAAIDIERNATVDTNPSHFEAHQKFTQFMDDAEVSSFGRWQWSNGFNTALTAVGIDLKNLPSAQPELNEWCTDCKEYEKEKHCCPRFNRVIREALKDAEPERKPGEWIRNDNGTWSCSKCSSWIPDEQHYYANYCLYCGADMRGEQNERLN